jgi:putative membrane protein
LCQAVVFELVLATLLACRRAFASGVTQSILTVSSKAWKAVVMTSSTSAFSRNWRYGNILLLVAVYAWSAVNPAERAVWWVEMASVLAISALLLVSSRWFRFSNTSYAIVSLWLIMHSIGAHYTFEKVPFDWVSNAFGFERNHYDRVAHFVIGINAFLFAEFAYRKDWLRTPLLAATVGLAAIMAMAAAWEIIEWLYAAMDGGEVGAAFLGSQGDVWDAQKDMLADTLGAILGAGLFLTLHRVVSPTKDTTSAAPASSEA